MAVKDTLAFKIFKNNPEKTSSQRYIFYASVKCDLVV